MEKIEDKDLGVVYIKRNPRAKHITARRRDGCIILSAPTYISVKQIEMALLQLKPKLQKLASPAKKVFREGEQISMQSFHVKIERNNLHNVYHRLSDGILSITIPQTMSIESDDVQNKIRAIIENNLKIEARRVLPPLVATLAQKYNFRYESVSIQKSRTRWGSCSSLKKINLSYWCMTLPVHLIEFVILHELCHTVEMNHGIRFWNLLDSVTEFQAKALTSSLKAHKTSL